MNGLAGLVLVSVSMLALVEEDVAKMSKAEPSLVPSAMLPSLQE
jgi:hypothetical protein